MAGLWQPQHLTQIKYAIREDLQVWNIFLQSFNGVSFWQEDLKLEAEQQVHSNTSGSLGFGVYFCRHWCMEGWSPEWVSTDLCKDLTIWKFFPILVTFPYRGRSWQTTPSTLGVSHQFPHFQISPNNFAYCSILRFWHISRVWTMG